MHKLVIAEKPSVAQSLAKVIGAYKREEGYLEGNGYLVSWCVGHLVELASPDEYDKKYEKWRTEDLPILPEDWMWNVSADKKTQFSILKKLMHRADVEEIICATDAGREGELIFRLVYEQAACKKSFKRLWISSMEDEAIKKGFQSLKDGHDYDNLYRAALCRSQADWLVGINGTRLFTTLYKNRLTVGRVQTPTLAMVVERNRQINEFQKEKYFNVHLDLDGLVVQKEKIFSEDEARAIQVFCDGSEAKVTKVEKSEKNIYPPKLYDLTTLQRESNRYFGYTAQKTLDVLQGLYEKKLITYPRTDSQYITSDMSETAETLVLLVQMLYGIGDFPPKQAEIDRIVDNNKVTDHHAILLTAQMEKQNLSLLSKEERDILLLIAQRIACATGSKQRVAETEIFVQCNGHEFTAKGKTVIEAGWKELEAEFRKLIKEKRKEAEEVHIPFVREGTTFFPAKASLTEHFTSPPKAYTEDTLLSAMEVAGNEAFEEDTEKKGIGTPATRASIIEKLVASRYLERKGKQLIPTSAGINLVAVVPEEVRSAALTAEWENRLLQIEKGELGPSKFISDIRQLVTSLISKHSSISEEEKARFGSMKPEKEVVGVCPRCGSKVYEGEKNFYCSNRECSFCIWKESKWLSSMRKRINKSIAKSLLSDGKAYVSDLYSQRKNKNFNAYLVLKDTGTYVNFELEFINKRKG